jgi:O-antigen/teichoic acid export membrane protein
MRQTTANTIPAGIASGALWSLTGQVLPALVGLFATPTIVRGLGDERFGLLALAWLIIGYFSLFDLGLGRAITKLVAERNATEERAGVARVVWTAWWVMLLLGLAAALVPIPVVPWLVAHGMHASAAFRVEAQSSLYLLLLSMPAVIMMNGFRGVLEAYQKFALVNVVRVPFGLATFVVPVVVLQFTSELPVVIAWLVVARYVATFAYAAMCVSLLGDAAAPVRPERQELRALLGFGAWITVSNVVGPLMVTFDRFVIGAVISVGMVAYYATPFQAVMQFLLLPSALATVLFPIFSRGSATSPERMREIFGASVQFIYLALYPCAIVVVAYAPEILTLWLGDRFGAVSVTPMRWLMLGAVMNGLAQVPFAFIQGIGRSDFTAKLHLIELPVYFVLLFVLARRDGINGVALAWFVRSAVDASTLSWYALRSLGLLAWRDRFDWIGAPLLGLVPLMVLGMIESPSSRLIALGAGFSLFVIVVWNAVLKRQVPSYVLEMWHLIHQRSGI